MSRKHTLTALQGTKWKQFDLPKFPYMFTKLHILISKKTADLNNREFMYAIDNLNAVNLVKTDVYRSRIAEVSRQCAIFAIRLKWTRGRGHAFICFLSETARFHAMLDFDL